MFTSEEYAGTHFVSAMEMARLLLWNTSNSILFAEFQICKTFEDVHGILKGSAVKPRYKYMQHFYDDWCSTGTGVENFAL
jgi:hypothetical protein